jgi:hypothetical protein
VLPHVGSDIPSIRSLLGQLRDAGYRVHLVNVAVEPAEAYRRMIGRFIKTGRIIPADYFNSVGTKPTETYRAIRNEGGVRSATEVDANGPPGQYLITDGQGSDIADTIGRF